MTTTTTTTTIWKECFSKTFNQKYWYNTCTKQSSWNKPYFNKKHEKYYYIHPKTKKSIWFKDIESVSDKTNNETSLESNITEKIDYTIDDSMKKENFISSKKKQMKALLQRTRQKKLEQQKKNTLIEGQKAKEEKQKMDENKIKEEQEKLKKEKELKEVDEILENIKNMNVDDDESTYTKHQIKTTTHAVCNGLGHYHEYEAPSHWDKYDHMEYLRDLRDSMNPYD